MVLALVTVAAQHAKVTVKLTAKPRVAAVMNVEAARPPTALAAIARSGPRTSSSRPPLR
jgi:hypothetical protein